MKVTRTASAAFTAEFESEEELREEFRTNLMFGALALPTSEALPADSAVLVTLRGPAGAEVVVKAAVVGVWDDKLGLGVDIDANELLNRLLPSEEEKKQPQQNPWDRLR